MKFERLGVFSYSHEEDTYAAINYNDSIPEEEKERRKKEIMLVQQNNSMEANKARLGQIMKVIIDRKDNGYYYGRTEFDSYEVDPEVLIPVKDKNLNIGEFYDIEITDCEDYDLFGIVK